MYYGVVSDTHIPMRARALPPRLFELFMEVEAIFHAGDVGALKVLDALEALAPTYAVYGNVDPPEVRQQLPRRRIVAAGDLSIGLIHGDGPGRTVDNACKAFRGDDVDVVIFGHSHQPYLARRSDVLCFNPGSPTDPRREPRCSVGILEITPGGAAARHIFL